MTVRHHTIAALALVGVLAVAGTACVPPPHTYVALGDSYVAGPLVPNQTTAHPGCYQSDHNYAALASTQIGVPYFRDVSCSGATTADMFAEQNVNPPPANPAQLTAVNANAKVVTLGIGGNDIGFTSIVASCIKPSAQSEPCKNVYVHGSTDDISGRIAATAPKVARVLQAIRAQAPKAKVLVVGYPDILPDTGAACYSPNAPFTGTDVPYLRDKEKELNAMLRAQAVANGARYVDTYTPSIGHDLCQPTGTRWVEGLAPTSPAAPVHPNAAGLRATSTVVAQQIRAAFA